MTTLDVVLQGLAEELAIVTQSIQRSRPNKPFTSLEVSLGLLAFTSWLATGLNLDDSYDYFTYANDSARDIAIHFVKTSLAEIVADQHIDALIRKQIPSFDLEQELEWATQKARHEDWLQCLTRAIIMYCRGFAYRYTGIIGESPSQILHQIDPMTLNMVGTTLLNKALEEIANSSTLKDRITNPRVVALEPKDKSESKQTVLVANLEGQITTVSQLDEIINTGVVIIEPEGKSAVSVDMQALYERYAVATSAMQQGDLKQAIEVFSETIDRYPEFVAARVNLAHCLRLVGRLKEALKHLGVAHNLAPNDPDIHLAAGLICDAMGDKEREIKHYHEALKDNPMELQAMNNLGLAYREVGDFTESAKWWLKAIDVSSKLEEISGKIGGKAPEKSKYYYNLALTYEAAEDWEKAIKCWEAGIALQPNSDIGLFQEGLQNAITKSRENKKSRRFFKR